MKLIEEITEKLKSYGFNQIYTYRFRKNLANNLVQEVQLKYPYMFDSVFNMIGDPFPEDPTKVHPSFHEWTAGKATTVLVDSEGNEYLVGGREVHFNHLEALYLFLCQDQIPKTFKLV